MNPIKDYSEPETCILTVSRSRSFVAGQGIQEGKTKNGKSRSIFLAEDMTTLVKSFYFDKKAEAEQKGFKMSEYCLTNEHGKLMHPDTFTKGFRFLCDEFGFSKSFHLHTLRHYFVSALLHNGVDKQTVAELAGHGDTSFLERTYCHPQMVLKQQASEQIARKIFNSAC